MNTVGISHRRRGFTIVELLIVIVIIGILAALVIVAYNGVQERAKVAAITSDLTQNAKKIRLYQAEHNSFPPDLTTVGIDDGMYIYQYANTSPDSFCLTATEGNLQYYISETGTPQQGVCGGYNLLVWNKVSGNPPVQNITAVDTTVFRTSTASMRFGPSTMSRGLVGNPYSGNVGDAYTVSLWIRTDSNWNGTNGNSKIRFGNSSTNALLHNCAYNGVKIAWTHVSCTYTLTSGNTSVNITVGNDGTTGDIWIDDLVLSQSH